MLTQWHKQSPDCEPVAHELRAAFPRRWVRFHSLPEAKRYPENAAEYAEVLHRNNTILGELLGPPTPVVLLLTEYSWSPEPVSLQPDLGELVPGARPWRSIPMHEVDDAFSVSTFWHLYSSVWEWYPGLFDPIVRLAADAIVSNALVVSQNCRWALHPYDGGMDVIAESPPAMLRLKSSYRDWLSRREDGL